MVQRFASHPPISLLAAQTLPWINGRKGCPSRHHRFSTILLHPQYMARPQHRPPPDSPESHPWLHRRWRRCYCCRWEGFYLFIVVQGGIRTICSIKGRLDWCDSGFGWEWEGCDAGLEEASYFREAMVLLRLAKEVIQLHQQWRATAAAHLNRMGGFSRSLSNSSTDWPCLLLVLLLEIDYFQVIK